MRGCGGRGKELVIWGEVLLARISYFYGGVGVDIDVIVYAYRFRCILIYSVLEYKIYRGLGRTIFFFSNIFMYACTQFVFNLECTNSKNLISLTADDRIIYPVITRNYAGTLRASFFLSIIVR